MVGDEMMDVLILVLFFSFLNTKSDIFRNPKYPFAHYEIQK